MIIMENTNTNNQTPTNKPMAPDSHLTWAIISTLLCCWPFGIPAIVNAAKVDKYWLAGHYDEAIKASNDAKKWANISAIVAASCWGLYILILVIAALLGIE